MLELFDDRRLPKPVLEPSNVHLKILGSEIVYALKTIKPSKAAGPDRIPIVGHKNLEGHLHKIQSYNGNPNCRISNYTSPPITKDVHSLDNQKKIQKKGKH